MAKNVQYVATKDDSVKIVLLEYKDLINENVDLNDSIKEAYGYDGLGILVVRGVPNLDEKRRKLLPLSHKYANLPDEIKEKNSSQREFLQLWLESRKGIHE